MMKAPWFRFLAYQKLMLRRSVAERNAVARRQFEQKLAHEMR